VGTLTKIVLLAFLPLWVSGCIPGAFVVAQETLRSALEARPLSRQIEDAKIHASLLKEYLRVDSGLPVDVDTTVWEGRVLLTGVVDAKWKREAVLRIAQRDPRIKAIYNHVILGFPSEVERRRAAAKQGPADERDIVKISRIASNAWIEAKIKAQLLAAEGVKSVNYRWQAMRNKVYIIGRARTESEKELVIHLIRVTKGVLRVEEYIQTKPPQK